MFAIALVVASTIAASTAPAIAVPASPPMAAQETADRGDAYLDELWALVAADYPEALRPEVRAERVTNDRGRRSAIAECLRDAGIAATTERGRLEYSNVTGQTALELAVSVYVCSASFVPIQQVTDRLDRAQLESLWDYYVFQLRPCLAASGYRTWIPPARADFAAPDGYHTWNPYLPLRGVRLSPDELDGLDAGCPAVPPWLDYSRVPAD